MPINYAINFFLFQYNHAFSIQYKFIKQIYNYKKYFYNLLIVERLKQKLRYSTKREKERKRAVICLFCQKGFEDLRRIQLFTKIAEKLKEFYINCLNNNSSNITGCSDQISQEKFAASQEKLKASE